MKIINIFDLKLFFLSILFSLQLLSFNQASFWIFNITTSISLLIFYRKNTISNYQIKIISIFFVFTLLILFTGFISEYSSDPLRKSIEIFLCILFLLGLFLMVSKENNHILFVNASIYSGLIISFYIIIIGIKNSFEINFSESLVSKNPAGFHLVVAGISIIYLSKLLKKIDLRYYLYYFLIGFALLLTLSLKSIIAFSLITFFLFFNKKKIFYVVITMIIVVTAWPEHAFDESTNYFFISNKFYALLGYETNTFADFAIEKRQQLKEDSLELFFSHPFLGIGLENTRVYLGTYSHHHWIELLAGGGILALILFATPIFYTLIISYRNNKKHKGIFFVSILIVIVILMFSQAQRLYDSNTFMILFTILFLSSCKNQGNQ